MPDYKVKSLQTDLFIIYYPWEGPGTPVITETGRPGIHPHYILTFSAPVYAAHNIPITVKSSSGLYIGLEKDIGRLVWRKEPFEWKVAPTGPCAYRFYPADGEDLYWYQNKRIEPEVGAERGSQLVDREPLFEVLPVKA